MSTDSESVPVSRVIEDELKDIDKRRKKIINRGAACAPMPDGTAEVAGTETPVPPNDEDRRLTEVRLEALVSPA